MKNLAPLALFVVAVLVVVCGSASVPSTNRENGIAKANSLERFEKVIDDKMDRRDCTCMNWRFCDGEINSDVACTQSYIFVCCVKPKPEKGRYIASKGAQLEVIQN